MKVVVIGGTGHIGSYLIPFLYEAGHEVIVISRGVRNPYVEHEAWRQVRLIENDRKEADHWGEFALMIKDLSPSVVVDLICYTAESARMLVDALRGRIDHLLVCGTIWIHGPSSVVPVSEENDLTPFGEYGVQKLAIERVVLEESRTGGIPGTVIHPGHIVGPGWIPLNPEGHFDTIVLQNIWEGKEIILPDRGMETVHHVHAEDVARLFYTAIAKPEASCGEAFHAVSSGALTLRGFAEALYRWRGHEPQIRYLPWADWTQVHSEQQIKATNDHILHSPSCSMEKARGLLGFVPQWSSLEAVKIAIEWLAVRDFRIKEKT